MNAPPVAKYEWGQRVAASVDLYNDGSFPDMPADALLVHAGESGQIVQVGTQTELNVAIYLVEFDERRVVGCFEAELTL